MEEYKLGILGIGGCTWTGSRMQRITVLYAGDEKVHEGGVAIMKLREPSWSGLMDPPNG